MNFQDVLNWEYHPTPLPQFSWEKKEHQVSVADLTDEFSSKPIQRFGQQRQQQPQPIQQSSVVQEYPPRMLQQKKGIGMFLEMLIIAEFFGLAIALLGNTSLLAIIGDSFMNGIRTIGGLFA